MDYNLNELEKKYNVKLDDTQKEVLSSLTDFIESDEQTICIKAKAGTGKSLILSMLYDVLEYEGISCAFITPTNKAKLVICNKGDSTRMSLTIHSLLNLRPNINILDFDASQLTFDFDKKNNHNYSFEVLLVDECSMINDDLYNTLCSKYKDSKIIWSGDPSQLAPINHFGISKTFNTKTLELNKIYRQPNGELSKILETLRHKPIYKFDNISDEHGNIIVCNNILNMLKEYSYLFKISSDFNDQSLVKLVTYTNNRISALNEIIRKNLDRKKEFEKYEVLTAYDSCYYKLNSIENSRDYVISSEPTVCYIEGLKGWSFALKISSKTFYVRVLSKYNSEDKFLELASKLENLRLKAIKTKSSLDWKKFYTLNDSFLTPIDLVYCNRVIKRKSIDYGYCISAHKSQSSEYSIVLVDMENIWRCGDEKELRQLQYVACSRTTSDLIIYQRNDSN